MRENIIIAPTVKALRASNFCTGDFVMMNVSLGIRTLEMEGTLRNIQYLILQIKKPWPMKIIFLR